MSDLDSVLKQLKSKARPDQLKGMARFGMTVDRRLGLSMPELRAMGKEIGKDHELALGLWKSGIAEARIVAALVDDPKKLTEAQMEDWVKDIDSWDVCDQLCMNLFEKSPLAWQKIIDWSERDEEFVKRTAFSLMACLAWHDKKAKDEKFIEMLPVIIKNSNDDRNFVRKAVNWALRNIGKRNLRLNESALGAAKEIQKLDTKTARWIAADAIRELESAAVQKRLANIEKKSLR